MRKSLIQGLSEKDMMAVLRTYDLNPFYYPTLMPLRFTPTLTWKTLAGDLGVPVAADVVSFNSSAPKKTRDVVQRLSGDIPKIEVAREKEETDLNEYNQLLHYASAGGEGAQRALVEFIYNDVEFCWSAVNARLEWLALRGISSGKVVLDNNNNNGIVTETLVDFQVPTANKKGVAVVWSVANKATAKPIDDIKTIVNLAKANGYMVNFMLMNSDTFDAMAQTDQVVDATAGWVIQATGIDALTPDLGAVNRMLQNRNLPQIRIIDSLVTIEKRDGTRTVVDPWEEGVVTFVPSLVCGNTFHAPLADELVRDSAAMKAKREHVMIKKFSEEDPVKEITKGLANAFPVWATSQRSFLLDTLDTSWGNG